MTDLQIGLLILGLLIIGGVIAFNWFQERKFHMRSHKGFQRPDADLLLDPDVDNARLPVEPEQRIDPRIEPGLQDSNEVEMAEVAMTEVEPDSAASESVEVNVAVESEPLPEESSAADTAAPAMPIGYIAEIRAGESIPAATIDTLDQTLRSLGRRYEISGFNYHKRTWEVVSDPSSWYTSVRLFVQLVDRSGAVQRDQLDLIASQVREQAALISAIAELPELDGVMAEAAQLDEFCVDVDVIVSLSVVAQADQVLHGTQLRALAEANGLRLESNGVFVLPDPKAGALFTMDNQESNPFRADQIAQLTTRGISFLLDVPRTSNGLRVFNKMVGISRQFADSLDGTLCDDNRVGLDETGLEKIRDQLRAIYENMEARGIPAGSATARHLFS